MIPLVYKGILLKNAMGFNRTFMELKQFSPKALTHTGNSFNRTFMELKPVLLVLLIKMSLSFNRTFMELKHTMTI